jgi:hypothetical protein
VGAQRFKKMSHEVFQVNQGPLYPGQMQLAKKTRNWERLTDAITRILQTA